MFLRRISSNGALRRYKSTSVRLGCASGFWGDTPTATAQLAPSNPDYIVYDYLSEVTMSLLTAAKSKKPELGFAPDFVFSAVGPQLNELRRRGIRVISNAGGVNTMACADALRQACKKAGVEMKIAVVTGDDLMSVKDALSDDVVDMSGSMRLPKARVHSMTAYFGAAPIVKALEMGADIVVTGRTADSALALAPLVHEFGWKWTGDWDRLAAGSLAGHLIECGGQATGGLFTDWKDVNGYENLGFPIVDVEENGDMVLSKPDGTGGLVNRFTVAEQMLYEVGDPSSYILPDVVCDFSDVKMQDIGHDRVKITGCKGRSATDTFKICTTYLDGLRATAVAVVMGGEAVL